MKAKLAACAIKLFAAVIHTALLNAPSTLEERLEPTQVELLTRLHFKGRLPSLPTNIRLGWKVILQYSIELRP